MDICDFTLEDAVLLYANFTKLEAAWWIVWNCLFFLDVFVGMLLFVENYISITWLYESSTYVIYGV